MTVVIAPPMLAAQETAWLGLLKIFARLPAGWCLVGGQLVHLHCWERGYRPNRPTNDADAALDVRARPGILLEFTRELTAIGFATAGLNMSGHQHRWIRGDAWIDMLIAEGLGQRGSTRRGVTGATTLTSPGLQQALDRTDIVDIEIAGVRGRIPRLSLHGALVVKAAYGVTIDPFRNRHIPDPAVLAALMRLADDLAVQLTLRDRAHLQAGLDGLTKHRELWIDIDIDIDIDGAEPGVNVLDRLINRS